MRNRPESSTHSEGEEFVIVPFIGEEGGTPIRSPVRDLSLDSFVGNDPTGTPLCYQRHTIELTVTTEYRGLEVLYYEHIRAKHTVG